MARRSTAESGKLSSSKVACWVHRVARARVRRGRLQISSFSRAAPLGRAALWRSLRAAGSGRVLLLNSPGPGASHPASRGPVTPTRDRSWSLLSCGLQSRLREPYEPGRRECLGGLVVRIPGFSCPGPGSFPAQGTEVPQAARHRHKQTKTERKSKSWPNACAGSECEQR